jgi:hypothetical protein
VRERNDLVERETDMLAVGPRDNSERFEIEPAEHAAANLRMVAGGRCAPRAATLDQPRRQLAVVGFDPRVDADFQPRVLAPAVGRPGALAIPTWDCSRKVRPRVSHGAVSERLSSACR